MKSFFYLLPVLLCLGCSTREALIVERPESENSARASLDLFNDITSESGLSFTHYNGMTGELYLPELMGSGTVLFDFDNDGDLDIYLLQGALLGEKTTLEDSIYPPDQIPRDQLFRNDLTTDEEGNAHVSFVNVTESSGIDARGYGMGAAVSDFNHDGWLDLYITNWGKTKCGRITVTIHLPMLLLMPPSNPLNGAPAPLFWTLITTAGMT